jgi:hypothetical protein
MGSTVLIGSVTGVEGGSVLGVEGGSDVGVEGGSVVTGLTEVGLFGVEVTGTPVVVGGVADVLGGMVVVVGTWHTWSFGKALTAVTINTSNNGFLNILHTSLFTGCESRT